MTGDDVTGDDVPDRALLTAHLAGDADAFPALGRRHLDRLYATAIRLLGEPAPGDAPAGAVDGAASAVQDGLLVARRAGPGQWEATVGAWLQSAVAAACLDRLRRPGRAVDPLGRAAAVAPGARPPPAAADALAVLPVDLRTVLVLTDVAGLPAQDAGTVLGLPAAAVRRRRAQGRAQLAQALGELPPDEEQAAGRHLDRARLVDLLLGDDARAARPGRPRATRHVTGCSRCSTALLELQQAQQAVADALARLPVVPVPATLAPVVEAALRARARPGGTPGTSPPTATAGGGTPGRTSAGGVRRPGVRAATGSRVVGRRGRRPRRRLLLSAAATSAVVVVVAVALVVLPGVRGARSGAGPTPRRTAPVRAVPVRAVPTSSTGTDYLGGQTLVAAVLPSLLRGGGSPPASGGAVPTQTGPGASPVPSLSRLRDPDELAGCLSGLSDPSSDSGPLALDYARYDGAPALLVVLPSSVAGRADVYVVGTDCRTGAADTLLFAQLPLPS